MPLRVVVDRPNERLALEGDAPRVGTGRLLVLGLACCMPLAFLPVYPAGGGGVWIAFGGCCAMVVGVTFARVRASRTLVSIVAGPGGRRGVHDEGAPPGGGLPADPGRPQRGAPFEIEDLRVEALDLRAEVLDFSLRIGAALGLARHRIARDDREAMEVVLHAADEPGGEPIPRLDRPANYATDAIAAASAAKRKEEVAPPFDPGSPGLEGYGVVVAWAPGREVEVVRPFRTLTFLAGVALAGFFAFNVAAESRSPGAWLAVLAVFLAVSGLWALPNLPRRIRIDWTDGALTIRGFREDVRVRLEGIAGIDLRCRHEVVTRKGKHHYDRYRAEIWIRLRPEAPGAREVKLADMEDSRNDPEPPYRRGLALADALAKALGVERRVLDYR